VPPRLRQGQGDREDDDDGDQCSIASVVHPGANLASEFTLPTRIHSLSIPLTYVLTQLGGSADKRCSIPNAGVLEWLRSPGCARTCELRKHVAILEREIAELERV
jgi:hypothetical protein